MDFSEVESIVSIAFFILLKKQTAKKIKTVEHESNVE